MVRLWWDSSPRSGKSVCGAEVKTVKLTHETCHPALIAELAKTRSFEFLKHPHQQSLTALHHIFVFKPVGKFLPEAIQCFCSKDVERFILGPKAVTGIFGKVEK